jgi:hypothetical protein
MGFEMFSSNTKSHDKIILKLPPYHHQQGGGRNKNTKFIANT